MRILPVIDLLGGCVVRGVAGRRESYRPIVSAIAPDAVPASVASSLAARFDFPTVYVADLDAIAHCAPAYADYASIAATGLRLWIDAGIGDARRAREMVDATAHAPYIDRLIVGLESLRDVGALTQIVDAVGGERLIFSLDLKAGRVLTSVTQWHGAAPLDIVASAYAAGFRRLIVLDLARVGVGEGTGTRELCRAIRARWPDVELVGGGGVQCADDLELLSADGLDYVLVASALHDGRLTPAEAARWR